MAEALAKSADYRVLRRLIPREVFTSSIGQNTKTGILLDVETTGLDQQKDEIIELGMVKFDYLPDGRIASLREVYTSFNEPSEPIPLEVIALTGITDDMVAGQRIDDSAVFSFVDDAVIVIAHNASFDRKFVERYWPIFQRKAWGCSATEVEWRKHGRKRRLLVGAMTLTFQGYAIATTAAYGFEIDNHLSVRSPLLLNDRTSEACCSFAS